MPAAKMKIYYIIAQFLLLSFFAFLLIQSVDGYISYSFPRYNYRKKQKNVRFFTPRPVLQSMRSHNVHLHIRKYQKWKVLLFFVGE